MDAKLNCFMGVEPKESVVIYVLYVSIKKLCIMLDLFFEDCVFLNLGCSEDHVQSDLSAEKATHHCLPV